MKESKNFCSKGKILSKNVYILGKYVENISFFFLTDTLAKTSQNIFGYILLFQNFIRLLLFVNSPECFKTFKELFLLFPMDVNLPVFYGSSGVFGKTHIKNCGRTTKRGGG